MMDIKPFIDIFKEYGIYPVILVLLGLVLGYLLKIGIEHFLAKRIENYKGEQGKDQHLFENRIKIVEELFENLIEYISQMKNIDINEQEEKALQKLKKKLLTIIIKFQPYLQNPQEILEKIDMYFTKNQEKRKNYDQELADIIISIIYDIFSRNEYSEKKSRKKIQEVLINLLKMLDINSNIVEENDLVVVVPVTGTLQWNVAKNAYFCPIDRKFRGAKYMALYANKEIKYIGEIKQFEGKEKKQLYEDAKKNSGVTVKENTIEEIQIINLKPLMKLNVKHNHPYAFVQGKRYVSYDALKKAKTTDDL